MQFEQLVHFVTEEKEKDKVRGACTAVGFKSPLHNAWWFKLTNEPETTFGIIHLLIRINLDTYEIEVRSNHYTKDDSRHDPESIRFIVIGPRELINSSIKVLDPQAVKKVFEVIIDIDPKLCYINEHNPEQDQKDAVTNLIKLKNKCRAYLKLREEISADEQEDIGNI